jgi:hypothetical protein
MAERRSCHKDGTSVAIDSPAIAETERATSAAGCVVVDRSRGGSYLNATPELTRTPPVRTPGQNSEKV